MDATTLKHFETWLDREDMHDSELERLMIAKFDDDQEFWGNRKYWDLYDAVIMDGKANGSSR